MLLQYPLWNAYIRLNGLFPYTTIISSWFEERSEFFMHNTLLKCTHNTLLSSIATPLGSSTLNFLLLFNCSSVPIYQSCLMLALYLSLLITTVLGSPRKSPSFTVTLERPCSTCLLCLLIWFSIQWSSILSLEMVGPRHCITSWWVTFQ